MGPRLELVSNKHVDAQRKIDFDQTGMRLPAHDSDNPPAVVDGRGPTDFLGNTARRRLLLQTQANRQTETVDQNIGMTAKG